MDMSKLSTSDKVLAGSGIALFIFSFFPWFGVNGYGGGRNGWDYFFFGIIPVLLGVAITAVVLLPLFMENFKLPELPIPLGLALLIAGGVAALLVVLKVIIGDSVAIGFGVGDINLDRKFGLFLSALAAIGLAAGGYLKFQEGGGELPKKGGTSDTGSSGTPTPN